MPIPPGLLQPLPTPNAVWEDISMDLIVGLPKSMRFDAILIVVDRLSKYGYFHFNKIPIFCSVHYRSFCLRSGAIIWTHGVPNSVVSD